MNEFKLKMQEALLELESHHLRRSLREILSPSGIEIMIEGNRILNFSSNDYLGLATEPFLKKRAKQAVEQWGVGSGSARLVCGNLAVHEELESETAHFKGTESALIFSSGYAVPLGVIPALVSKGDTILIDKLAHACLIDGARLSGATIRVFPHQNLDYLEKLLKTSRGKKLIVTESVFSMDGDLAPLKEIIELKEKYGAWLMIDEAHATGVFGKRGAGLVESLDLSSQVEVQMGTYSKALGSSGGYVAGSRMLCDYLLQKARSFIFSTAPSPASSAVSLAAVRWVQSEEGVKRRRSLAENVDILGRALNRGEDLKSPIYPWIVGESNQALMLSDRMFKDGFLTAPIRYPTVPRGKARIRISLSAKHCRLHIDSLIDHLQKHSNRIEE